MKNAQESNGNLKPNKRKSSKLRVAKGSLRSDRGTMAMINRQRTSGSKRGLVYIPYKRRGKSLENKKKPEPL
jgi:hypothetical protein